MWLSRRSGSTRRGGASGGGGGGVGGVGGGDSDSVNGGAGGSSSSVFMTAFLGFIFGLCFIAAIVLVNSSSNNKKQQRAVASSVAVVSTTIAPIDVTHADNFERKEVDEQLEVVQTTSSAPVVVQIEKEEEEAATATAIEWQQPSSAHEATVNAEDEGVSPTLDTPAETATTTSRRRAPPQSMANSAANERINKEYAHFQHQLRWTPSSTGAVMHVDGNLRIVERAVLVARQYRAYSSNTMPITLFTDAATYASWQERWRDAGHPTGGPKTVDKIPRQSVASSAKAGDKSVRATDTLYLFSLESNDSPFARVILFENLTMPELPKRIRDKASSTYRLSAHLWLKKIVSYLNSPYEKSVFLDADTCPCSSLDEYFKLLDDADVVNTIEHKYDEFLRGFKGVTADSIGMLGAKPPMTFAERNCGFIGFRKSARADAMLLTWLRAYLAYLESGPSAGPAGGFRGREGVRGGDQPAYREAMYINLKHGLREHLVARAGSGGICRGLPQAWRKSCSEPKVRDASRGVACSRGCLAVHEKCECWSHRPAPKANSRPTRPADGLPSYANIVRMYARRHRGSSAAEGLAGHDESD
ncbi:hypothetical protein NFJ02_41g107250 [Pycnococcus provasolii]